MEFQVGESELSYEIEITPNSRFTDDFIFYVSHSTDKLSNSTNDPWSLWTLKVCKEEPNRHFGT